MKQNRYADITDNELLQRYLQSRNNQWLGVLLQRYTLLLLGVCMKYLKDEDEAQDAVQQVFLKVLEEVHKYKIDYFRSWIYMVAKNYCLTTLRNKKGKTLVELTDHHHATDAAGAATEMPVKEKITPDKLSNALNALSSEQRQCVNLFYLQKMSYAQISENTGYSLMQVKSYIQNGKRNLKLLLEQK